MNSCAVLLGADPRGGGQSGEHTQGDFAGPRTGDPELCSALTAKGRRQLRARFPYLRPLLAFRQSSFMGKRHRGLPALACGQRAGEETSRVFRSHAPTIDSFMRISPGTAQGPVAF